MIEIQDLRLWSPDVCAALHADVFSPEDRWDSPYFFKTLQQDHILGEGLVQDGRLVGLYMVQFSPYEGDVLTILVKREEQNKGHGRRLMSRLLSRSRQKGLEKVFLEVAEHHVVAQHLYQSLGFQQIGVRTNYYRQFDNFSGKALTYCYIF